MKKTPSIEYIFVFDDPAWLTLPAVQLIQVREMSNAKIHVLAEPRFLMAALYNAGKRLAEGDSILFDHPLKPCPLDGFSLFCKAACQQIPANPLFVGSVSWLRKCGYPDMPDKPFALGWQTLDDVVPISFAIFPKKAVESIGDFDESLILQRHADWDFMVRAAQSHAFDCLGSVEHRWCPATLVHASQAETPSEDDVFIKKFPAASTDLARRYLASKNRVPVSGNEPAGKAVADALFLKDISAKERAYLAKTEAFFLNRPQPESFTADGDTGAHLRIAIVGGYHEHHHNQLGFYNVFDKLKGSGFATYKVFLESNVDETDLFNVDLVILTRTRGPNTVKIIALCKAYDIACVYVIDDNWINLEYDRPQDAAYFKPGEVPYETFMYALKNCDATLTFNPILAEDLKPYARRIIMQPINIEMSAFDAVPRPVKEKFVIGYAGSRRYIDAPFAALGSIARTRDDVEVIVFGYLTQKQEDYLKGCMAVRENFMQYSLYIKRLRELGPDILLAPLDSTHTAQTKCANKYLEITALGAVGVYSHIEPYIWCVKDGVTGAFVKNGDDEKEWESAILSLMDKKLLGKIAATAREDVIEHYAVEKVARIFQALAVSLVEEKRSGAVAKDPVSASSHA